MTGHRIADRTWYPQQVADLEATAQVLAVERTAILARLIGAVRLDPDR